MTWIIIAIILFPLALILFATHGIAYYRGKIVAYRDVRRIRDNK